MSLRDSINEFEEKFVKFQFGSKDRLRVYRKLSSYLANGIPLISALDMLYAHMSFDGRKPKTPGALAVKEWRQAVSEGLPFGKAAENWLPERELVVIQAGEKSGSLSDGLRSAIHIHLGLKKINSTIIGGLSYPMFLVAISFAFVFVFTYQVVPPFDKVLPKEQWTGIAAALAWVGDVAKVWFVPFLIGLVVLVVTIFATMSVWTGEIRKKFDKIPPWSIYRMAMGTSFMLSAAALNKAGVKTPKVLMLLAHGSSPWYRERLVAALHYVNNGHNLGEALHMAKHEFPDLESVMDLRAYAGMKDFDESMRLLAEEWLEESVSKIELQTAMIRNASFLMMTGVLGFFMTAVFSLQAQIQSSFY